MIAELLSLTNLAALFIYVVYVYWSASRLVFIISIIACLFMQVGCLYYLKIASSITIACLVVNGSLAWNVMSLKF